MISLVPATAAAAALLLLLAGATKVRGTDALRRQIDAYQVLPAWLAGPVAKSLPYVEISAALVMFVRPSAGGWLCALLYGGFSAGMAINLAKGRRELECGCFGKQESGRISWGHVGANVGLGTAAVVVAVGSPRFRAVDVLLGVSICLMLLLLLVVWDARIRSDELLEERGLAG